MTHKKIFILSTIMLLLCGLLVSAGINTPFVARPNPWGQHNQYVNGIWGVTNDTIIISDVYNYTQRHLNLSDSNITAAYFIGDGSLLTGSFNYTDNFDQDLNTTSNVTFNILSGNGTGITEINWTSFEEWPAACTAGQVVSGVGTTLSCIDGFTFSDHFDQYVNTTSNVVFNEANATTIYQNGNQVLDSSSTLFVYSAYFDQDLNTTDAFTVATLDTGQGANELYAMNQDLLTTSAPTFANGTYGAGTNAFEIVANGTDFLFGSIDGGDFYFNDTVVFDNGGSIYGYNSTCLIILSPGGTGNLTVCD